ncbi:MAG: hypothetical protein K0R06_2900, partial [Clostridium sp.]|nr:hypothetical protein [Clostridium sp.]
LIEFEFGTDEALILRYYIKINKMYFMN